MKNIYIIIIIALLSTTKNVAQSDPYLGEIRLFAIGYAPRGWLPCNGQLLPINNNQALYSILGIQYGGNGVTNFALPDLRGKVVVGAGVNRTVGQSGGKETQTIGIQNLPNHNHAEQIKVSSTAATTNTPTTGAGLAVAKMTVNGEVLNVLQYNTTVPNISLAGSATTFAGNPSPTAIPIMQPFLNMTYCIALSGLYPSQN